MGSYVPSCTVFAPWHDHHQRTLDQSPIPIPLSSIQIFLIDIRALQACCAPQVAYDGSLLVEYHVASQSTAGAYMPPGSQRYPFSPCTVRDP